MTPSDYKPSKELQELWRVELELSDVLLDICVKKNLKIWAAYGTLIGAARHKGFIPWDDDVDFVMMREDYDKLLKLIESDEIELPLNYKFDTDDISVIKLRRNDTTMINPCYRWSNELQQGVWIDVFCLDVAPDNLDTVLDKYENIKKRIRVYRNRKIGFYAFIPRIHYIIGHFLLRTYFLFNSLKKYRKNTENILRDDVNTYSGKKLWGFLIWSIVKKNIRKIAIHDISSYEETVMMPFEDRFFPCPKGYDELLTAQYGDWRTPVMGGSQHEGTYVNLTLPYKEYIKSTLKNKPWWKRYWYKH